ncbi:MAG TPA: FAD-dependent oxidoreductase [Patescibacteria group bacterium]|nr:FAD-dependent oxidoreductase [Patescibacteria group bacterium]
MSFAGYIDTYYADTLGREKSYRPLHAPIDADVCIVGGGFAGLNTALSLAERGRNVALLEGKRIGWGSSGRNAGFVAKGYAADEAYLLKKLGLEMAREIITLTQNARRKIQERIATYNIDCGPVIPGVLTASWRDNDAEMRDYVKQSNDNFNTGFEFWNREQIREACKTDKYYNAVYSPQDFQFHPLRYVHGLAAALESKGGQIFENSPVIKIEKEGMHWRVATQTGSVRCNHVVLACSVYIEKLDRRLAAASFPVQTYIMVTKPMAEEALAASINTRCAISDMRFCSDYYRRLDGGRVLWGGRVALWSNPKDIAGMMQSDMFRVYPQLKGIAEPEYSWAGLLAYAPHKMPQIGEIEPGYWYATGFGGHGIAPTTVAGEVVAAAIAGGDDTYKHFSPFGLGYAGGKLGKYVAQLVYWWWRARDHISVG